MLANKTVRETVIISVKSFKISWERTKNTNKTAWNKNYNNKVNYELHNNFSFPQTISGFCRDGASSNHKAKPLHLISFLLQISNVTL